jgi:hypothetical protein
MSVKLSKDCVIDPNMKIEVNDIPVNYQIADEGVCYKLSFNSDVKADTHYWVIFENDKITLPNGTKNWKLYFEFDTVLRSSIDLPDSAVFIDLPQNHWAYRFISELSEQGIISEYGDKTFKPENNVTRAELAKLLYVAFNVSGYSETTQFTDIENHWAAKYISVLANIIPHSGNIFRPNDPVTREEAAASIARLLNTDNTAAEHIDFTDTAEINPALLSDISYAVNAKIIYGYEDGSFHPQENIYRSEIAAMLYRAMSLEL